MAYGGSMPHSQGLSNNPYPTRINQIPHIHTYFFKIHSNIVLPSTPRAYQRSLSSRLPATILKEFLPCSILVTWFAHLNLLYLITLTIPRYYVNGIITKYLIMKFSPLPILICLGPKYSLRILFSSSLSLCSSLM